MARRFASCAAIYAPNVARRASAYLQPALAQPDLVSSMAQVRLEVKSPSADALAELRDAEEWRRLIKLIGFTAES